MFDIGFSELLVIAVVALIVIGPERLPKVARTAGHLFGRLQRYVNDVKADINREMELDELRRLRNEFEETARSVEQSVSDVQRQVRAVGEDLTRSLSGVTGPALPSPADDAAPAGDGAGASDSAGALPPPPPQTTPPAETETKVS